MVRHHYDAMKMIFDPVIMQAMFENQASHRLGQDPPIKGNKGDEERFIFYLEMGQITAIFTLGRFGWPK